MSAPMNDVSAPSSERPAARPSDARFWPRLWRCLSQSQREAYLAQATDLVDLERRQRAWERSSPEASALSLVAWR
jgi:Protein of unknown function (DUF3563)